MSYDPQKHHRRSLRLKGYDYSKAGAYFITICTYNLQTLFGEIIDGKMQLNQLGEVVAEEWERSAQMRQEIELDYSVIMPNHLHGIVIINNVGANGHFVPQHETPLHGHFVPQHETPLRMKPRSISSLMAGFKSAVTKRINRIPYHGEQLTTPVPVWQRNYYEHIIRNETSLNQLRQYIIENPLKWEIDQLHPNNPSKW
ncbi:transposase [Hydrocoleum sp. CS-953]|uniref:transposase n=1 Tax=Hydrocoleum sp. CS-953 TaxID=1671698 RepID=UPI000B9BAC17|nr:transposase [Hydrocoleum sp. CS-953]OZH51711.1 transposase [Hydrocoleum sp. CS-953]